MCLHIQASSQAICIPFAQVTSSKKDVRFQSFYWNTNMAFLLKRFEFVKTSIILCVAITLCNANMQSATTRFTGKKSVATSHTTLQKVSKIKCVERCNKERQKGRCTLARYNKYTKTCYLSVDDPQDVFDTTDDMIGVFFYEPAPTSTYN